MMKFHVLTLFPEMVSNGLDTSVIGKAAKRGLIWINAVNIRDYTQDKHGKVDDYTYGGGAGMLLQAQPVFDAFQAVTEGRRVRTIYVTPQGVPFTQKLAGELAAEEELVFLCGHYEGIDERVLEEIVTDYVSIGDYVLTGGELPAMVMIDAISRLVPGVLGNGVSADTESFHNDLLEYPQYSRPEEWHEKRVPQVLLSGDHRAVEAWRLEQAKERTRRIRPDLYEKYRCRNQVIQRLGKEKRDYVHLMEALRRGKGEILFEEGCRPGGRASGEPLALAVFDRSCGTLLLTASDEAEAGKLLSVIPDACALSVASPRFLADILCEKAGFELLHECYQVCYTQNVNLRVGHGDIRILTLEHSGYVAERYGMGSADYVAERIRSGAMYGAFAEDRLVGFIGIHEDGSVGMLYVDPDCRRQGIGAALEAYAINRERERGHIPYAHIIVGNEGSLRLQEKLGLYRARRTICWLAKKACISEKSMLDS